MGMLYSYSVSSSFLDLGLVSFLFFFFLGAGGVGEENQVHYDSNYLEAWAVLPLCVIGLCSESSWQFD